MPKQSSEEKAEPKLGIQTTTLKLTRLEVAHLRDVLGLSLPPDLNVTLSQALAAVENRKMEEARLWSKVAQACEELDVPMGDDAPDFIVSMNGIPSLGVFKLNSDIPEEGEECTDGGCEAAEKQELQDVLS